MVDTQSDGSGVGYIGGGRYGRDAQNFTGPAPRVSNVARPNDAVLVLSPCDQQLAGTSEPVLSGRLDG